jgi:glyoxylase-like metal-dependent hydrolase (beta-lactamase superfamily II)
MKQRRVTAEITQLTRLGLMNCFLVREDDGLTLVDTTIASSAPAILAAAKRIGQPIRRILLTHAHLDHTGALDVLVQATGAEVSVGARESGLLAGDLSLDPREPQTRIRGSFKKVGTEPDALLRSGDMVSSLRTVSTPGHTPGHLAFFDTRSRTLLAGDAVTSIGELRVCSDAPWYFPFPMGGTWHAPTALLSAADLADLDPRIVVCGHGKPITDGTRALAAALAHAELKVR